jgi:hypothetical protein
LEVFSAVGAAGLVVEAGAEASVVLVAAAAHRAAAAQVEVGNEF